MVCFITYYVLSCMCSLYKLYIGFIEVRVLRLNLFLCGAAISSLLQKYMHILPND